MNEVTWKKLLGWEQWHIDRGEVEGGQPQLLKFTGRPFDLTPKARIKSWFGYGKGCYFLVFVQLFEKYGTLTERNTALIEEVSPCRAAIRPPRLGALFRTRILGTTFPMFSCTPGVPVLTQIRGNSLLIISNTSGAPALNSGRRRS
eukprot:SAG31_NODE_3292_length_4454_cov_2.328588_2_plen_146_part_00